jgi:hypothetical protein
MYSNYGAIPYERPLHNINLQFWFSAILIYFKACFIQGHKWTLIFTAWSILQILYCAVRISFKCILCFAEATFGHRPQMSLTNGQWHWCELCVADCIMDWSSSLGVPPLNVSLTCTVSVCFISLVLIIQVSLSEHTFRRRHWNARLGNGEHLCIGLKLGTSTHRNGEHSCMAQVTNIHS